MEIENFVLDVDGVLCRSMLLYTPEGKAMKVFGPDDHDALNLLRDRLNITFISGDKRGFPISRRRIVDEMKFDFELVSTFERVQWMAGHMDLGKTVYMGDGIFDVPVFEKVAYSICPQDGFYLTKEKADFVTKSEGGNRAVAEACVHILGKFFGVKEITPNTNYGVWKDEKRDSQAGQ